jgi:hypothetical protein
MKQKIELWNRYELADFFGRMCLFLQYRDLRNSFQAME